MELLLVFEWWCNAVSWVMLFDLLILLVSCATVRATLVQANYLLTSDMFPALGKGRQPV